MIKSRESKWAGYAACLDSKKCIQKALCKPMESGHTKERHTGNIKIDLGENDCEDVNLLRKRSSIFGIHSNRDSVIS
jgi:hypothetical protein